jgi:hypothetical protein
VRPHLLGNVSVRGAAGPNSPNPGELVLDGLLVEGTLTALVGNLGGLRVLHSTLVPGPGGLTVNSGTQSGQQNDRLIVTLERTISGLVQATDAVQRLVVRDSIVQTIGGPPGSDGPALDVETSTVLGPTALRSIEASNCIFAERVTVARRQTGCVRFCFLPLDSLAPRRYRCQPADEASAARVFPRFTSTTYGQPGYGQLAVSCPEAIAGGAEDGGELGAFNFLQQAQRLRALRASLDEYLRFGMEAGIFFVT